MESKKKKKNLTNTRVAYIFYTALDKKIVSNAKKISPIRLKVINT